MRVAFKLASDCLPKYRSKFSRKDFTLPQLFACLVLREHQKQTYRGTEALLRDSKRWCREIGMKKAPDHNTLWRAFGALNLGRRCRKLLDLVAQWFALAKQLGDTVALDSTYYDTHHRSRHYERRCRHYASQKSQNSPNTRRSRSAKQTPKLAAACDPRTHLILALRTCIGMGSDAPDFDPLLVEAWGRMPGKRLKTVLADAGYDSEDNHRTARQDIGIRSLIKPGAGRPSRKPAKGKYRRRMQRELSGSQAGKPYGQRAQVETVMSMLKRNLGDALRARTPKARRHEMILKAITHNVMIRRFQRVETEPVISPLGVL